MGILNMFKNQLSKVIQWENQPTDILWWKYPSESDEIKNASKLIVAPGQGCVLVYEGKIMDVITESGIYLLETDNHPFITTLSRLRLNFESEHKLKIYFYRIAEVVNQYWGTATPVKYIDEAYNIPIELGVNGNFSFKISDINQLYINIVASKDVVTVNQIKDIVVSRITQKIGVTFAQHSYSYKDIDKHLNELSNTISQSLEPEYSAMGLSMTSFNILGTAFDQATIERISKIADMTADVKAAKEADLDYASLQKIEALRDAARNEGGIAGIGAQLGAGMEIANVFNPQKESTANIQEEVFETLKKLKSLADAQVITSEEFETKKKELLSKI